MNLFKLKTRINQWFILLILSSFVVSCGSSKSVSRRKKNTTKTVTKSIKLRRLNSKFSGNISRTIRDILKDAEKYIGTPYKFGGNTPSGFDCSGFTMKVFEENNFTLPRRSADQAITGKNIDIKVVKPGDLLFFATAGGSRVSHVGIVYEIGSDGEVKFIHVSTSKEVMISSLNEKYWNKAYLHAQRVL